MIMRSKLLYPTLLALSIVSHAFSQQGFKIGANFSIGVSSLELNNDYSFTSKLHYGFGGTGSYMFNDLIGLQVDARASFENSVASGKIEVGKTIFNEPIYEEFEDKYTFGYVDVPVKVKASLGNESFRFNVFGGVSSRFNILAVQSRQFSDDDYNDDNGFENQQISTAETFVPSVVGGVGLQAKANDSNWYTIDFNYEKGLDKIATIDNADMTWSSYYLTIGYLF